MPRSFASASIALLALGVAPLRAAEPNRLDPGQVAEGWISLFDGETLFGWKPTSDANWKVEDGAITVSEGEQGFLTTGSEFADYELHVEFKAPESTNSGIFLHTPVRPADPTKDCYELNVAPIDNPFPTGSLVGRRKFPNDDDVGNAKWESYPPLDGENEAAATVVDPRDEGWISFDVKLNGDNVTIGYFGHEMYEYVDPQPLRHGHIALQFREGPVAFRNIRLRPIGLKPMLNGKDLAGWNAQRAQKSKFEVTPDGELQVTGGNGQLESEASYGDFVMQLDCFVDGDSLNSGIFFRCIPGQYTQGYESQIHNGYQDGDPTKPTDFGTGGVYRRVPARRVVSKDHEWFTKTIIATGPHIAVWVNGFQVTDWTDDRPPHDNPREGLRTAPGTIAIQGHDPTTDLRFRNFRIAELPKKANHDDTTSTTGDRKE